MNFITITENSNLSAHFFLKSPELDDSFGDINSVLKTVSENVFSDFNFGKLPVIAPSQVHKSDIITVNDDNFTQYILPNKIEADGIFLLTDKAEATLRFADCAPVLIYPDEKWAYENFPYVLLLHSGFKGTVLNIVSKSLDILRNLISEKSFENVNLWCGACISQDDYPRDFDEWTEKALKKFSDENVKVHEKKYFFDIKNEIKNQALKSGLKPEKIFISDMNTFRDLKCYSYRRGDKKNRMILHAYIKK